MLPHFEREKRPVGDEMLAHELPQESLMGSEIQVAVDDERLTRHPRSKRAARVGRQRACAGKRDRALGAQGAAGSRMKPDRLVPADWSLALGAFVDQRRVSELHEDLPSPC